MSNKLFSIKKQDYRKIITFCGIKIKLKQNKNLMLLDIIDKQNKLEIKNEKINKELQNNIKEDILQLKSFIQKQVLFSANLHSANNLHQNVFPKYKNINQGKDVVLIATGPSLKDFIPIENAIYVGVNKAFQYDKVKFDYLFLQDYSGATPTYIEEFCNYNAKKFLGYIPDYIPNAMQCIIPEKYSYYPNVERYYLAHPTEKNNFTFDISSQPLGDAYSIAFPAMQFILWTNPKRIYLVGCDCSLSGYHDKNSGQNNLAVDNVIDGWKRMKEFAKTYYPDTEIISVNPVGLKDLFKDLYQKGE